MKNIIIGIDPGDKKSAMVIINESNEIISHNLVSNRELLRIIDYEMKNKDIAFRIGIEMIASYGMPVGKTVFETCVFIGRLVEVIKSNSEEPKAIYRKDAKMFLCNSMKAKDGNIRQAIIDLYPATGGGKNPQVGTKKQPGALFGISSDKWAALAVALTAKAKWNDFETFESWINE